MKVGHSKVEFNAYEAMKHPNLDLPSSALYSLSVDIPHDQLDPLRLKFQSS